MKNAILKKHILLKTFIKHSYKFKQKAIKMFFIFTGHL